MKRIKITEKQAEKLGLKTITENGELNALTTIEGVVVRIVISGDAVSKFKDRIIQLISRQDPTAKVGFFDATNKIVGNVKDSKLNQIKRDINSLDPSITIEKKPIAKSLKEGEKNLVKITKEQYNRIFASNLLSEGDVTGGLNRVDKTFKKEFAGKPIQNIKSVSEEKFNITKPNKSVPKLGMGVGKTEAPISEEVEKEGEDQIAKEVLELIKYLYRKSENISSFWKNNGLTYDAICDHLLSKNLIVKKGGKYELTKVNGNNPQEAIKALENEMRRLIKPQAEVEPISSEVETGPEIETEASNVPTGSENDPAAPWNQNDDTTTAKVPAAPQLEIVAFNNEIALFKGPDGSLYVFYYGHLKNDEFIEYASLSRTYVGRDEEGQPEYEYDKDFEIDSDVVSNYVNDKLGDLSKGEGLNDYESGDFELVKLDEPLKQELISLYDKDKNLINTLSPIEEAEYPELMNQFKANMDIATTPKAPSTETPEAKQSRIVAKLQQLKDEEKLRQKEAGEIDETTTASSGSFVAPLGGEETSIIKRELPNVPVVSEMDTASAGNFQYDSPAGLTLDLKSKGKTKAEKTTQYAGGSFVKQPDCSKPNNNKSAQSGGCNQGASSLKTVKTGGSINAPSLGENSIYQDVANKTGKTLEEVKKIIESKK